MKESILRDLIANDIRKLKSGLTLLQKEKYIPNEHGTKSFIDLYAKDENNRHVLIELKRSDAAARQAIHEVNKYIEGVKQYFGVKDAEVHVIIASTEWTELLVPFSRFIVDAGFSIEGIDITIADSGVDFEVESVTPLPIIQGRFIAPWHNVYWYTDKIALEQGISSIQNSYSQKGITDYIIVTFYMQNLSSSDERRADMRATVAQMVGVSESELSELPEIPVHEYIAYTALQTISKEMCLQILSHDKDSFSDVQECLSNLEDEEALCYLHECIEALKPYPKCDYYEIGYPAKFSKFFEDENSLICGLIRHGIFERNSLLSDNTLYSELRGEDGSTGQKFKRIIDMKNLAHVKSLKEDVSIALEDNPVWRNHILRIIEEIQVEFPCAEIEMWIHNPCTGIFTIYYATTRENGLLYIPSYHIIVRNPNVVRMYYGTLQECGAALTFPQILNKYYQGELAALLLSTTWGGRDSRDSDIIEDLGAQYRSYYIDINGNKNDYFALRDEKWRHCDPCQPFDIFAEYIKNKEILVRQITRKIYPRDMGAFFSSNHSYLELEKYVDMAKAKKKKQYFYGAADDCDICKCSFEDEKFMVDGELRDRGAWANMCADCFIAYGKNIAWGEGQLYQKDAEGWLLVGGSLLNSNLE